MQEIKKRRIVLASVLKPVGDTRMFEKMALSLARDCDVHVIGSGPGSPEVVDGITQYPLGSVNRFSLARFWAPLNILRRVVALRPAIFIVCTHELLIAGVVARMITGCKLWYDLQENYARNIRFTNAFPKILRLPLAAYVRLKERLTLPFCDRVLVAERSYVEEMPFLGSDTVVIENKYKSRTGNVPAARPRRLSSPIQLLFSGTLAESTGVYRAVAIADALWQVDPQVSLHVIGFAARPSDREALHALAASRPYVRLTMGSEPVSHRAVVDAIAHADVGIISYPVNPSTSGSVPTKLYEYLANRLPILLTDHAPWVAVCNRYQAAVIFEPERIDAAALLPTLYEKAFYTSDAEDVFWESEEGKLRGLVGEV